MNEVLFVIDPGFDIYTSSTFADNSFKITNSTNQNIVSISLDLSTAIFPDLVYDPTGEAGDSAAKNLVIDLDPTSNPAISGVTSHEFLKPRDGGFDVLKINFSDFKPNKKLEFSVDTDPTSTKGAEQSNSKHYGSISGLELVGATATVNLADGTSLQGRFYRIPGSETGSQVTLTSEISNTIASPIIEAVGKNAFATVADANQTIKITGKAGSQVSLLIVEGALYVENNGFDIDPFEANTAIAVNEVTATIGSNGTVNIPVTLTRTDAERGGYNYFIAKYQDSNSLSSTLVLELDPVNTPNPGTNPAAGTIRIEAEDYKAGTNGTEYFDFDETNNGGEYRPNEMVDIQTTEDVGGGFNVAWIQAGEHLTYDINIAEAGNYNLVLRVANPDEANKQVDVVIGGKTYSANFGNTGGFQTYANVVINNVNLSAGTQQLRLDMKSSDFNLNYIELVPAKPVADQIAPVATLDTKTLTQQSNTAGAAIFTVTFSDNIGIDAATIDAKDVTVTAPNGTVLPATLVSINAAGNGTPRTATYSIAAPGGTWDAADKGDYKVAINAGEVKDVNGNVVAPAILGNFSVDVSGSQTSPPTGTIRIEAEDYKAGKYFDTSRNNYGGAHRRDDVDIEATKDVKGGYNVAWIEEGEYLTYDVNIPTKGSYDLVLRVATSSKETKKVDVVIGEQIYTASFSNTGGWQTYQDVVISNVNLSAGKQELRLDMKSNSFNLNYIELVAKQPSQPSAGTIRIEAENYKAGTNGTEYFDFDATNNGGEYRPNEIVDIQTTEDVGGGFNVAWIQAGEHLTYDVNIAEAGNYNLVLRVANPDEANKQVDVAIGGKTYSANFGNTGGFQTYANVVINNVNLSAGTQQLRLDMKSSDFNLNYIELVPVKPVADQTAPVVKLENTPDNSDTVTLNQLTNSTTTANFSVTFADNIGIDVATIDANDVTVTAPNGSTVPVSLVGINTNGNGNFRTATYSIAAPGGTWDAADVGDYSIAVNAAAVSDTSGNTTTAKTLGKLALNVLTPVSDGVIRINAGASADAIDSFGKLWQADANFIGGQAIAPSYNPIDNTKDDFIYQSQRSGTNFSYAVPVANGNYNVSLYLSELNFTNFNSRLFNVSLEGNAALNNLDIYKLTNNAFLDGQNDASIVKIPNLAIVRDGILNLDFASVVQNATLAGIAIAPIKGAQVLIEESQQKTSVTEGGNSDTYQVLLNTKPTANVTINLQLDGQTTVDKTSLVFTPDNWDTPQTVTVNAVDDAVGESFHISTIGHTISTSDSAYSSLTVPSVSVNIIDNDSVEVKFQAKQQIEKFPVISDNDGPSTGAWGPDGRLYVAATDGQIRAYTFDDNYNVIDTQTITTLTGLSNKNITGIAFNPFENTGGQPRIYVSHNQFYANYDSYLKEGGFNELTDFSPYSGQVSVLEGSNFTTLTPIVKNIGVSNHDHGVNGLAFDSQGDLLITVGSNTNAGIADDAIGGLDESPFTAAILKAKITKPNFNGNIQYQFPTNWAAPEGLQIPNPQESQGFGGIASVVPGVDVSVYAAGLRNPYDLVYATNGTIYATENDANGGFGDVSTSATTQEPFTLEPYNELNIIKEGNYYGQPNRNRGRTDDRQNKYYPSFSESNDVYTAPIEQFDNHIQGIVEYRSTTFGGQLRGNLLTQNWNGFLYNVKLSEDGTKVLNKSILESQTDNGGKVNLTSGLDVLTGFGGTIISIDHSAKAVYVAKPFDDGITNMVAYDISDWRASATGGGQFTIGGLNFSGFTADTSVTIGNKTATITSVTGKRIVGIFPTFDFTDPIFASTEYTEDKLLDITVASGGEVSIITDAFQPLFI